VVSVHLDTLFPEGTEVTVKEKAASFSRRALATTRGLAALLTILVLTRGSMASPGRRCG
jgi:hypothetical protein